MNYQTIKEIAAEYGISYKQLIALAPQNDPFYAGTPGDIEKAEWFADLWNRAGYSSGVHLRRVHYWAVSQEPAVKLPGTISWKEKNSPTRQFTDAYVNVDACWKYLCQAAKLARYLGLVAIGDIIDQKNPDPHLNAIYGWGDGVSYEVEVPDIDFWPVRTYGFIRALAQPFHLEVWCEKSTMNDVLLPVCQNYQANLVTFEGEVSITACHNLIKRVKEADKPARVFYISDFDPAGNSMPVAMSRKVEFLNQNLGLDIKVEPIILTMGQVVAYQLPRVPIKASEVRAGKFEDTFGEGAVELDALEAIHPGELAKIVKGHLSEFYSIAARSQVRRKESQLRQAIRRQVDTLTSQYEDELEKVRALFEELETISVDLDEYEIERQDMDEPEESAWLYDSARSYVEQVEEYHAHKAGER